MVCDFQDLLLAMMQPLFSTVVGLRTLSRCFIRRQTRCHDWKERQ